MRKNLLRKPLAAIGAAAIAFAVSAQTATAQPRHESAINWAVEGGIADWYSSSDRHLYVKDRAGRWFLATFAAGCPRLDSAPSIAFEASFNGRFEQYSRVVVDGVRCEVASLVRTPAPAAKGGPAQL